MAQYVGGVHKCAYDRRNGQDYVQLGDTGGLPGGATDDPAAADHLMWISLNVAAPQISNTRLGGLFDKQGTATPTP